MEHRARRGQDATPEKGGSRRTVPVAVRGWRFVRQHEPGRYAAYRRRARSYPRCPFQEGAHTRRRSITPRVPNGGHRSFEGGRLPRPPRSVLSVDPGPWVSDLAESPWRRVWTLNVDDVFEAAYRKTAMANSRQLEVLDWQSPYAESGRMQVVHLHGHVHDEIPRPVIFSLAQYVSSAENKSVWFSMLKDIVAAEPLVIVGARMLDDPDMEALLVDNRPVNTAPSVVVDPYIPVDREWQLRQWGFDVLKMTGQDFTLWWRGAVDVASITAAGAISGIAVPQFHALDTSVVAPPRRGHDLYSGDHPEWHDVVHGKHALFGWVRSEIEAVEAWADQPMPDARLRTIYAPRLSGTTTGLLALAREAVRKGIRVFLFDRSSRWHAGNLCDLARVGPTVFIIEGAADFGDDIDRTLIEAAREELPIYVVASDVRDNSVRFEGRLGGAYGQSVSGFYGGSLKSSDSSALLRKLADAGRLGALANVGDEARRTAISGLNVFSAMMLITRGERFETRLRHELLAADEWVARAALVLGLAAEAGRPVGIAELARAVGVTAADIASSAATDEARALLEVADSTVYARQREAAAKVAIASKGKPWARQVVEDAILRLAPQASQQGLRMRNRIPMLVGHLMTFKRLAPRLGGPADLEQFYENLRPSFGQWSARYWEQAALCARARRDWTVAESYAGEAVRILDDAYTRTTAGSVSMAYAADLAGLGLSWVELFEQGEKHYRAAFAHDRRDFVSALSFLRWCARLAESAIRGAGVFEGGAVRAAWDEVYVRVRVEASRAGEAEQTLSELERISARWNGVAGR
ncbi:hypothetical protein GC089_02390 [Cellulomonas sp. JZ18]|uniref:SIR2 family protein n=1 Tax=Cellulomonas sp. JZ18 TaxID=2654191 RepID=UPI0012D3F517|nr:SIR2 family protein [Cellulomonas sp. JZ18]QGQ18320.1 hypothetical protein GC089_02390 [Cellulomonas sp. JZ18]